MGGIVRGEESETDGLETDGLGTDSLSRNRQSLNRQSLNQLGAEYRGAVTIAVLSQAKVKISSQHTVGQNRASCRLTFSGVSHLCKTKADGVYRGDPAVNLSRAHECSSAVQHAG